MSGEGASAAEQWRERIVTVRVEDGLHARPAIRLSQLARTFAAAVRIGIAGQDHWVDVKSVSRLMGLRVESGSVVVLRAAGEDALAALAALGALIERNLDPDGGDGG